jgi:uncharacterized protein YprB with RNaseH-like and TPR domain
MSAALAQRLAALRRQAGATSPPSAPSLPDTLRRLLDLRAPSPSPSRHIEHPDRELPGDEIAPSLRLREWRTSWSSPPDTIDAGFAKGFSHVTTRQLLLFDTETTGLAGGTGTRAFMIGAADWYEGQLRVRQLLITRMAAEAAMLDAFAQWLCPETVLVSYNGRCYDAPLLTTRYRLARQRNPLTALAHLDLLHPTRRRYRGVYENCRLATIERRVLGIVREDDLPGSEAPRAWRDYLNGGSARDLRRVLAHNQQDVVTLARLLEHLAGASRPDPWRHAPRDPGSRHDVIPGQARIHFDMDS